MDSNWICTFCFFRFCFIICLFACFVSNGCNSFFLLVQIMSELAIVSSHFCVMTNPVFDEKLCSSAVFTFTLRLGKHSVGEFCHE